MADKISTVCGRKVAHRHVHGITFLYPINKTGEFRLGKAFDRYTKRLTDAGYDVDGGHQWSIAIVGKVKES